MTEGNHSQLNEFILTGLTNLPELQIPLFVVFLLIYCTTVVGNLGLIFLTRTDSRLQTPMYFFLGHLALVDVGHSTSVGPQVLVNLLEERKSISFYHCAVQFCCFITFIVTELFLLSAMAYDRYVAICNPLLYKLIISEKVCTLLVVIPYIYGLAIALFFVVFTFRLSFCGNKVIDHFYCDSLPILKLSCSDTHVVEYFILGVSTFNLIFSLLIVLVSYISVISTILKIRSAQGRRKVFSTCGSHLVGMTVFYGTLIFMYLRPPASHSFEKDKMASVFYTQVLPMLNPLIYSLRNREVKEALERTLTACWIHFKYLKSGNLFNKTL
ncbi:olfactory receptor 1038-like [Tachyglossus aculeatus]|uniref:olfactory receptor 1038-like n=1 Tax=Tachyglossus aculeatus TaxID=9261 RepID=UPI0018F66623|nr:olfactory receptor 1038-like [Tachyglossus aculeatus]